MTATNLQIDEDSFINELICELLQNYTNQDNLRKLLLKATLKLIPTEAPLTILRITSFFSEIDRSGKPGQVIDFFHINQPPDIELLDVWEKHVRTSNSMVERKLFSKFGYQNVGTARLVDLFSYSDLFNWSIFQKTIIYWMIRRAGIKDLAFSWLRCAPNEIWVLDLRRLKNEPDFSDDEMNLLNTFVKRFYDFRKIWFKQPVGNEFINDLSQREQEAIYHFVQGLKDKETAYKMNISKRTLDTHWQNIFNKLGVSDKIAVLDKLGMLNKKGILPM